MAVVHLTPGNDIVVLEPEGLWWAPRHTKLAPLGLPLGLDWATYVDPNWTAIKNTMNGVLVQHRNPTVAINSEENDRIGTRPAGTTGGGRGGGGGGGGAAAAAGAGTAVQFQALTFEEEFWLMTAAMSKVVAVPQTSQFSITFTGAATTNGNITIGVGNTDGYTTTPIQVAVSSTTETSATLVATKVALTTIAGWTLVRNGATVTFTAAATGPHAKPTFAAGGTGVTVSVGDPLVITAGHNGATSASVDKSGDYTFMVAFEALSRAGELFDEDMIMRGYAYRCENTVGAEDRWRRTGTDSVIAPNLTLETVPEDFATITSTMIAGTGITANMIHKDSKFDYFWTPASA